MSSHNRGSKSTLPALLVAGAVGGGTWQCAYALSGDDLVGVCTDKDKTREALCVGYVSGVSETLTSVLQTSGICAPDSVSLGKLITVVVDHINAHPEKRQSSAVPLVWSALVDTWPCPGMKTPTR
ncbi:MAG: Rap1a/Tai family immunity protein [Acidiferrobacterales bacterium]|nr:Rap1a/Tai family immunity protein [Acidiferrobacterales bacterium]